MQEKIYSLERRLNATGRDREGTGELLRVERYDIWGQNRATTASPLIPEYLPDAHVLSRRQSLVQLPARERTHLINKRAQTKTMPRLDHHGTSQRAATSQ